MGGDIQAEITRIDRLGGDICAVELKACDGGLLPEFSAGSHVDVHVRANVIRPYSLCGDPADRTAYRIAVLRERESRGGSMVICTQWREGDLVHLSNPRNLFALVEDAAHHVLIAGGIGVTPLIAMAHRLHRIGASFELTYCARDEAHAAFLPELQASDFAQKVRPIFSTQKRFDFGTDVNADPRAAHIYVCGPASLNEAVLHDARKAGWPDSALHSELFDAETDGEGDSFTVKLTSGETYEIPSGASIASLLISNGHDVQISCQKGICGSCITDVIEGTPDHRDHYLTDDEKRQNDCMALCCSRALTDTIVIDLDE